MSSSSDRPPPGTPEAVIVTVFDESVLSKEYMDRIKENRRDYATRHGSCPCVWGFWVTMNDLCSQ